MEGVEAAGGHAMQVLRCTNLLFLLLWLQLNICGLLSTVYGWLYSQSA
jgi:hypothetical protein